MSKIHYFPNKKKQKLVTRLHRHNILLNVYVKA